MGGRYRGLFSYDKDHSTRPDGLPLDGRFGIVDEDFTVRARATSIEVTLGDTRHGRGSKDVLLALVGKLFGEEVMQYLRQSRATLDYF